MRLNLLALGQHLSDFRSLENNQCDQKGKIKVETNWNIRRDAAFTCCSMGGLLLLVGLVGLVSAHEMVPPTERGRVAAEEV